MYYCSSSFENWREYAEYAEWEYADNSHSESESGYNYRYQLHWKPLNSDPWGPKKSAQIKGCSNSVYPELRALHASPTENS